MFISCCNGLDSDLISDALCSREPLISAAELHAPHHLFLGVPSWFWRVLTKARRGFGQVYCKNVYLFTKTLYLRMQAS